MIDPRKCTVIPNMTSIGDDGKSYLLVKDRLAWFLQWARENNHDVSIKEGVEESDIHFCGNHVVVKVRIFIDGKEVAVGVGSVDANLCPSPLANAATIAKGRALANLGFGVSKEGDDDGELSFMSDSPVAPSIPTAPTMPAPDFSANPPAKRGRPRKAATVEIEAEAVPTAEVSPAPAVAPVIARPASAEMTKEKALSFVCPIEGAMKGLTLGEMSATMPWAIAWLSGNTPGNSFDREEEYPELVRAARLVYELSH